MILMEKPTNLPGSGKSKVDYPTGYRIGGGNDNPSPQGTMWFTWRS